MTPEQYKLALELISNPPQGSKLAEAKQYGIDLTLLLSNLAVTPTQRAIKCEDGANSSHALRQAGRKARGEI